MRTNLKLMEQLISKEFSLLKNNLEIHFKQVVNLEQKKSFLSDLVPKELLLLSDILLDSTLNELMKEAQKLLEDSDVEIKNKFYEYDFRKRIKEWTRITEGKLSLEGEYIKHSTNPQLKEGLIAGGITFILGSVVTKVAFIPNVMIGAIVAGLLTVILSALAFRFGYKKAYPKAIDTMKRDVHSYIDDNERQVNEWLGAVIEQFKEEFNSFCIENGIK